MIIISRHCQTKDLARSCTSFSHLEIHLYYFHTTCLTTSSQTSYAKPVAAIHLDYVYVCLHSMDQAILKMFCLVMLLTIMTMRNCTVGGSLDPQRP